MYITQAREILEACPTAKLEAKSAERLIRSIEEEEESMLEPLLGEELMLSLATSYASLVTAYGGITTDKVDLSTHDQDEEYDTIQLLRTIQGALVYRMLANKIYSLSTSFNLGAGASRAAAGDYEPADDKHMQELRKEYFMNSRRACDNILVLLERDARSDESQWIDLWKSSDSYYLKEDLLFPTIRSLKPYIRCDQPSAFIGMCPDIRYCQDTYITPRISELSDGLMDTLLDPTATLTDDQKKAQKQLRAALAYYVMAKQAPKDERLEMHQCADNALSTALTFIEKSLVSDDQSSTDTTSSEASSSTDTCTCDCCKGRSEASGQDYSTFSTLFDIPLNRF